MSPPAASEREQNQDQPAGPAATGILPGRRRGPGRPSPAAPPSVPSGPRSTCRARRSLTARSHPTRGTNTDSDREIVDEVGAVADARRVTRAQVALAWLRRNPVVAAPVVGARTIQQIDDAVACMRSIISLSSTRKSMLVRVDIGWGPGYGFSRSPERQQGLAGTNCRPAVRSCSCRTVRWWSSEARFVAGRRRG
ncbi:aldo/keto reductase [Streptomyces sp. NPDC058249]|uniref:aldo/keto reductase n=1 Tax=Streptomyces sp. NPDC058249 TaxID=3346403 RepID=UPI0036E92081